MLVGHRPMLMARLDKLAGRKDGALEAFGPAPSILPRLRPVAGKAVAARAPSSSPSNEVAA